MHIGIIIGLGGGVGFLSGLFGVGGGFLMTPLLIFFGIPPAVAVSTEANQIVASSVSGVLAHMRRGNVDFKMGGILMAGGVIGSTLGVALFSFLREIGRLTLSSSFPTSFSWHHRRADADGKPSHDRPLAQAGAVRGKLHQHNWLHGLPFKMRFRRSKLYIAPSCHSASAPLSVSLPRSWVLAAASSWFQP